MRQLRSRSGKAPKEAAQYAGIALATLYRIENASHAPKPADIIALCRFYGLGEHETDAMALLARQGRQRGWWHKYGDVLKPGFDVYVGLEEEASTIKSYHQEIIGGLMQTPDYTRAVLRADLDVQDEDEIERTIAVRAERQRRAFAEDGHLEIWAIVQEAALRLQVGGPAVMRAQLEHLHELSRRQVFLQVLPFSAGAHPSMSTGFYILGFPHPSDTDVAYIEHKTGGLYLEQVDEVSTYARVLDQLKARALGPDESRALIKDVRNEMR